MSLPQPRLLVITDRRQAAAPLDAVLTAAFAAGCRWASIREKDLSYDALAALAARLKMIAHSADARLSLHGDPEQAHALGMDGLHLAAGGDAQRARAIMGRGALIGISIHTAAEAAALEPGALDYAIAGPAFDTASKPGYGPGLGSAGIAAICAAARVPIIAIGGVDAENVAAIQDAGAAGIAVMGGVMRADDPAVHVQALIAALSGRRDPA